MGVLICWGLYLICGGRCSIAWLYISAARSDILVMGRDLISLRVVWIYGGKILGNRGWILIRQNMGIGIRGQHCSGRNDLIVDGRLDEALMEGWSGLGDVVSFWGPFFPRVR